MVTRSMLDGEPRGRPVAEIMRRDFVTVRGGAPLAEAYRLMRMARLRHLIVEKDGELLGILTYRELQEREIERLQAHGPASEPAAHRSVDEALVDTPHVVGPDTPLPVAATRMSQLGIGCLPVVEARDDGVRLVGLVTTQDLLRAAYRLA